MVFNSCSGSDRRRISVFDCEYCVFYGVALSLAIQLQQIDIGSLSIASEMITIEPVIPSGFPKPCTTRVALTIGWLCKEPVYLTCWTTIESIVSCTAERLSSFGGLIF